MSVRAITPALCSTSGALDDCHLTQSHNPRRPGRRGGGGRARLLAPLTSCTHTGRLGREDLNAGLFDDLGVEWDGKKTKSQ